MQERNLMLTIHFQEVNKIKPIYLNIKKILKRERVKFFDLEQMFLILRYLPEVDVEFISDINRTIAPIITSTHQLNLQIEGVDIYPYKVLPKVLWFRITEQEQLRKLAENLDKALIDFGFKPEDFAFYPHITFARIRFIKDTSKLDLIEQKFQTFEPIPFTATEVKLIESIKTTKGNIYKVRNRFMFKKSF